ncbi:Asp-tRNA(Asn)/Glu-tRNA(Gln) amidotransferase subunit GatB [Desulfococcaceae bacterium HSG9]|nr:Asp-tRNA(Asn)/Glu-tRNA(Gln) amidotransferase subunit GatB [Desulfococcaceae bacterium HSG9]
MQFEPVIGLEVHAQLKTETKIFCNCATSFGAPPNTHTCPVCLGMPGVLPVLNKKVVDYAMRMALATHCKIGHENRFARKNYFYPDLPKGYQISQYELPLAEHGYVDIEVDNQKQRIGLTRIHLEEDAGKLLHDPNLPISKVDLNRTGTPLIEIVSEPDLRTPAQAGAYLRQLRTIVRYLGICDGNLEEGSFRCDANISIRPQGSEKLGTRTELKNLNSFKNVEKALRYEIMRQQEIVADGGVVIQESRLWNDARNRTASMRGKEEAHDYRYFPDPDLLPIVIDDPWIEKTTKALPELPDEKKARFIKDYHLPDYDASFLTTERASADYFESCIKRFPKPKLISNWIMGDLAALLNAQGKTISQSPVSSDNLADLLRLIEDDVISGKIAKTVFEQIALTGETPQSVVEAKNLTQVTDVSAIEEIVLKVIGDHPKEVETYRNGKKKLRGFFVGQVMKATRGKANPKMVNKILSEKLESE